MNRAYALKFNNGADFWRVYNGDTGFCISEHNSKNAARKKVKRLNKRMKLAEKKERMDKDLAFFIECISGRKIDPAMIKYSSPMPIELGNCKAATPCQPPPLPYGCFPGDDILKQKGNNPMRIDNTTATAYVTTPKSDDATSREYLLGRLSQYEAWHSPKLREITEFFNLGKDGRPKTYLQLIDAIKNDKFSLDPKVVARLKRIQDDLEEEDEEDFEDYGYGPFYGVIFNDFPKPDREGYDAAVKQFNDLLKATKDTIMVKSPDDGLTALQALEAWVPVGKAN